MMYEMLFISEKVRHKLQTKKPSLNAEIIEAAWVMYQGLTLFDTREEHWSDPPTEWFIVRWEKRKGGEI